MATARSEQVDLSVTPYYHCMTRCVRRAFLCGEDHYSGKNFDHRKEWVRGRLRFLSSLFAIDVCAYAVMSNHLHVVLHVDQERGEAWSEAETVTRYTTLYPMSKRRWDAKLSQAARQKLLGEWRERLTSISWMMRALSEFIARKANQEEGTRGRFWEGRFKSQALLDEAGLLTCMAYVDLNPVRAGLSKTLEASDFTSIQERLQDMAKKKYQRRKQSAPKTLAAMHGQDPSGQSTHIVPMSIDDYIGLLKWTGSLVAPGKRGTLAAESPTYAARSTTRQPAKQPTILREHGISPEGWLAAMRNHALGTTAYLGSVESLDTLATQRKRKWLRGIGLARQMAA